MQCSGDKHESLARMLISSLDPEIDNQLYNFKLFLKLTTPEEIFKLFPLDAGVVGWRTEEGVVACNNEMNECVISGLRN